MGKASRTCDCGFAMSRQYNMHNVQQAEMWKQRVARENTYNTPIAESEYGDDDQSSMLSGSTRLTAVRPKSDLSVASSNTVRKIEELERKLDEERRKREGVERKLAQLTS